VSGNFLKTQRNWQFNKDSNSS